LLLLSGETHHDKPFSACNSFVQQLICACKKKENCATKYHFMVKRFVYSIDIGETFRIFQAKDET
jgi:hypothetical protein